MGFIKIENITLSPPSGSITTVSVAYKLASDPDVGSSYTTVTNDLQIDPDGDLTNGPFYIYNLLDSTAYTVQIFNECTAAKKNITSTAGAGSSTTTTHAVCDYNGIPNLVTWIDFSDLTTLEISDGGIEVAQDKSSNNNDFVFFERSPSTVIGYNGQRGCYFDGNAKMRSAQTLSDTDSYTIITVGDLEITRGSDNDGGWSISTGGGAASVVFEEYSPLQYDAGFYVNPNSFMTTFTIRNQDADSRLRAYDNGYLTNEVDHIPNSRFRSSSYGIVLGAVGNLGTPEIGLTHEILIFNRVLTDAELGVIHNCLRLKYDIEDVSPWYTSTTTTLTPPTTTTTSTTTTEFPPASLVWEFYERGGANSYIVINSGPTGTEQIREDHPTTDAGGFGVFAGHLVNIKANPIPGSVNPNSYYIRVFNATDDVLVFEQSSSSPIDYITPALLAGKTYVVTVITDLVATTTSTTTTLGPATVNFSFTNEGEGQAFYSIRSGVDGNENLQVAGFADTTGSFSVPAGHKLQIGLFDDAGYPIDPDFYRIIVDNVTDTITIYDSTDDLPQSYTTPALVSGKTYLVTLVVDNIAPVTTTTTLPCYAVTAINGEGAPTKVQWSYSNSGNSGGATYIGIGDTLPGTEVVAVRWSDATKSGTFYPDPEDKMYVLVSASAEPPADPQPPNYYYVKVQRLSDGAILHEEYDTSAPAMVEIPLDEGETYIVTTISGHQEDTGYILFNDTDRFDSGESNLIKHS